MFVRRFLTETQFLIFLSKYDVTSRNYALNTGSPHSLSNRGPPYKLGERSTGSPTDDGNSVPLKNPSPNLWYGSIAVGEPPETFTGEYFQSPDHLRSIVLISLKCKSTLAPQT
jgi:hypothetical protein